MMQFPRTKSKRRTRALPLIPMIDIVFILIVFFMLTTSFMKVESLELQLPSDTKKSDGKAANTSQMVIVMEDNGDIRIAETRYTPENLRKDLKTIFTRQPELAVKIIVSPSVTTQSLVSVFDAVSLAGGRTIQLQKN